MFPLVTIFLIFQAVAHGRRFHVLFRNFHWALALIHVYNVNLTTQREVSPHVVRFLSRHLNPRWMKVSYKVVVSVHVVRQHVSLTVCSTSPSQALGQGSGCFRPSVSCLPYSRCDGKLVAAAAAG